MNAVSSSPVKKRSRSASGTSPAQPPLFGDAVAIVDRRRAMLSWASPAWLAAQPTLKVGTKLAELMLALPQTVELLHQDADVAHARSTGEQRPRVTDDIAAGGSYWAVEGQHLGDQQIALRLSDRRENGRALQRQLSDRESLLFTSRVLSVGEMATTLAHELNQPIAAAANLLRGLRSRLTRRSDRLNTDESAALDRTIDQVMFASQVITRIRDFTKSHEPRPTQNDLAELLRNSASLLDWDLQRAGIALSLEGMDTPVSVRGDRVMLQQVVINLMRNSIDALRSDPPVAPKLAVRLILRDSQAEVQVSDNGCGLDDEAANRLFVPFASSKPTGMGLGLSICRSFIELHQGKLWFSRNPDRGTTFHMALPMNGHDAQPTGAM